MQESYTNLTYNCARIMCKCWGVPWRPPSSSSATSPTFKLGFWSELPCQRASRMVETSFS